MIDLYQSIVITGGSGMLAHALAAALRARGLAAAALPRAELNVADPDSVAAMFRARKPTLVLNASAYTNVDGCEKDAATADAVNGHAVGHLASMSREYGTALVHYSTDFVFDGTSDRPYRPDDPTNPLSAYGRSKLLGERLLQDNAPHRWLILRTAWLFGRNGRCFPRTMVELARAGRPLKVVRDQTGSPTLTDDLAAATLDLLDRGANGIWHVVNNGQTTWFDFTAAALDEFGATTDLTSTTAAEWRRVRPESATRPAYSVLDTTPFTRLVGREMRPWRDALRDYQRQVEEAGTF